MGINSIDMKGFKVTDISFNQEVNLPAGIYTYSFELLPVSSTYTFRIGAQEYTFDGFTPGVLSGRRKFTFELTETAVLYYPSRTVGDCIYKPQFDEGNFASTPGPHELDFERLISEAGIDITDDALLLYAKSADVDARITLEVGNINSRVGNIEGDVTEINQTTAGFNTRIASSEGRIATITADINRLESLITDTDGVDFSAITQEINLIKAEVFDAEGGSIIQQNATSINLKVENLEDDLEATGINITKKEVEIVAPNFKIRHNDPTKEPVAVFTYDSLGNPLLKAQNIDTDNLIAKKLLTPFVEVTTANFQSAVAEGNNVRIRDQGASPILYGWVDAYLPAGQQYDGLTFKINIPTGSHRRIRIKPQGNGRITWNNDKFSQIKVGYFGVEDIELGAQWNPLNAVLDWVVLSRVSYRQSTGTPSRAIPNYFKPGDIIASGTNYVTNSWLATLKNNWYLEPSVGHQYGTGYTVFLPFPYHFNGTGEAVYQSLSTHDVQLTVTPTGEHRVVSMYGVSNTSANRLEWYIRLYKANGTALIEDTARGNLSIQLTASKYIVQNQYLESTM